MNPPNLTSSDLKPDEQEKLAEIERVKKQIIALINCADQTQRDRGLDLQQEISAFGVKCYRKFGQITCTKTVAWRAISGSSFVGTEYTFDLEGELSICQFMAKLATREQL